MNRDAQSDIFDAPYSLNQIRKRHIEAVLDMVNRDLGAAAKLLGLNVAVRKRLWKAQGDKCYDAKHHETIARRRHCDHLALQGMVVYQLAAVPRGDHGRGTAAERVWPCQVFQNVAACPTPWGGG